MTPLHTTPDYRRTRVPTRGLPSIYQGMVAYWPMIAENGVMKDFTGRGNNLTHSKSVGRINGGFPVSSSYLYSADNGDLSIGSGESITLAAWIYPVDSVVATLISKDASGTNRSYRLGYSDSSTTRKIYFYVFNNGSAQGNAVTASGVSLNAWSLVVAQWDAANQQIGVSINGGAIATASYTGGAADCTSQFRVGMLQENNAQYFNGVIDEVCVWKRLLTADEVTYLYNGGNGVDLT